MAIGDFLRSILGGRTPTPSARAHLSAPDLPAAIYAIGDIHGCLPLLHLLHEQIFADAACIAEEKWLVYLGDYVDRGPNSAGVLDALLAPPPAGFRRIALAGNHEVMMLNFLEQPARNAAWLQFGGPETLASYGLDVKSLLALPERQRVAHLQSRIPQEHIDFLAGLPLTLSAPGLVFVHAGLRPGIAVAAQAEDDALWIRGDFFSAPPREGLLVVHGHTPARDPVVTAGRICVDTGAFATGLLTAVKITGAEPPHFISATIPTTPL